MRLSKSKINTYKQCPRRYKYDYKDGLARERDEPLEGTPLRIGLDVHEIFEWYYLQPGAAEIKQPYDYDIDQILRQHPKYDMYPNFMDNFVKFNMRLIDDSGVPGYLPEDVELRLHDENLNMVGIIDVVFKTDAGRTILDYKTGKPKGIRQYREELIIYKMLYEQATGKQVDYCGIYFPLVDQFRMMKVIGPGEEVPPKTAAITLEDEFYVLSDIDDVRERIIKEEFPAKPGFLCGYCDYKNLCVLDGILDA